ncbi:bifunctional protein-serine/threonine kinase/phosphatase [Reyranella sp. CPCC 100927]|uniref:bifunctional protein-serine/threonine kinase/phosphatase n=1 Tax=Reyranella sp. CPCC 100927 TaxID=2599616 RepID=UPI0011B6AC57|nr:bifunctional protein-serine/threonine kinase/phosphatase [Reyranella sp. CPCC 100927]TWS94979.1 bifunctional protein-serine/threonine kinase/phosphatase [Reyranella sp. CPCC 100927]
MPRELRVSIGQHSDKGRKQTNQDFHGALIPAQPVLGLKGIAVALADGVSSSAVGGIASESAVKSFLADYYCTSESWSVKTSAQRVIAATNSWLHAQTRRSQYAYERDKGYVCTLSVMVVKSATAYIFHVGDARIYRVSGRSLEQLTDDHRVIVSSRQSYLGRALGADQQIEIDYRALALDAGDVFIMVSDGVHEHVGAAFVIQAIDEHARDLDQAARVIAQEAYDQGSPDNLTVQIVRVDDVSAGDADEVLGSASELSPPPLPDARMTLDGYRILRQIHAGSRSHVYLAVDTDSDEIVALKIPSTDLRGDAASLRRFMMEEWVARRIDSAHVLKPRPPSRRRNYLYVVTEYIEGTTLAQWMIDNPRPDLETVRGIVEQIAKGLRAFHRLEMLHQDLRPQNIMIDKAGTVRIIDFGAVRVAGVLEASPSVDDGAILGTAQYTAPEYFLGDSGTPRADLFSLGVIAYQMLTGQLPYGAQVAQARTRAQQRRLVYRPARAVNPEIPAWVDGALEKAVRADPYRRYEELSEFTFDLRHPREAFLRTSPLPLMERRPLLFWKGLSFVLACTVLALLAIAIR